MRDSSDVERTIDPATGLIQIGWPGGMLTRRYTGIPTVTKEAQDEIQNIMKEFSADCQMMLVWFVGVLNSRGAIQHHLDVLAQRDEPLTINSLRPDGRVASVFVRMPAEKVQEADGGSPTSEVCRRHGISTATLNLGVTRRSPSGTRDSTRASLC